MLQPCQDTNTLNIARANAQAERQWVNSQLSGEALKHQFFTSGAESPVGNFDRHFPFIIFLALVSGMMVLKSFGFYLMTLFWLQLWAPIAAIMNLILTSYSSRNIYSELMGGGQTIVIDSRSIVKTALYNYKCFIFYCINQPVFSRDSS